MITLQDVHLRYGRRVALDGLSLHVPAGSAYGLLGRNGAGKTTAIECLAGLRRPERGRITVAGVDMTRHPAAGRARIGLVPQSPSLWEELTPRHHLRIFGGLYGLCGRDLRHAVARCLDFAGLADRATDPVRTLSGGMKRRLALALALVHDPPVLLCDEPTTGVDAAARQGLIDTLRSLRDAGRTLVYTTHQLDEAERLCDHIGLIDAGRAVTEGPLEAVLDLSSIPLELAVDRGVRLADVAQALAAAGIRSDPPRVARGSLESVLLRRLGAAGPLA